MKKSRTNLKKSSKPERRPWMKSLGKLRHLRKETARIERLIEEEFERIEPEDRK
jgi:hypothetical protein